MDDSNAKRWDNDHFLHPWEGMKTFGKNNRTFVESGNGIYVMNDKDERLIDGPGGMWCTQIGYGREEMAEAMAEQARSLAYFSPFNNTNSAAARLAREIAIRAPGDLNNVFFTTGGSTAVDTAIRFIHFRNNLLGRPEKKKIISRQKAYHGSTYLAASVSGKERDRLWLDKADDLAYFLPDVNPLYRVPGQSEDSFLKEKVSDLEKAIVKLGPENVAAFIAEPVLASGGVIVPPNGYHDLCLKICKKYDVLYISDEVVTAFGRLGHWFSSEAVFGVQPDIITCAKGMTSGYSPMGAAIISDRLIADVAGKGATFSNGYTYSGHPVSAAAGLMNIEIIEREKILEHVRRVTPIFQDQLQQLRKFDIVDDVRGMGLMGCVQCSLGGDKQSELERDYDIGLQIDIECQKRGLLVRPVINMCVLSPPLIISESEIDTTFSILREGLEATSAWFGRIS